MPCLFLDGRAHCPPGRIRRLRELGFRYRAAGR